MWDLFSNRRCLVKPNVWQVQGHCYLDLFLFDPPRGSTSEIRLVETLIRSGKQKFLIHPLIEIFLKEKWGIIGKIYFVAGKVMESTSRNSECKWSSPWPTFHAKGKQKDCISFNISVLFFLGFCVSLSGFAFTNYGQFWFDNSSQTTLTTKWTWRWGTKSFQTHLDHLKIFI